LYGKYLIDIRSEAWPNFFVEYINGTLFAVCLSEARQKHKIKLSHPPGCWGRQANRLGICTAGGSRSLVSFIVCVDYYDLQYVNHSCIGLGDLLGSEQIPPLYDF
jgi:hypothetical protein